jgi:acetoin utilization protein AcuB
MFVGKRMTKDMITIEQDEPMTKAAEMLKKHKIRRMPVLKGEKLVGIVSDKDLRSAMASSASSLNLWEMHYLLDRIKVKELMTKNVITVAPETTIEEAAQIMRDKKIGGLPVLENTKLVGIITETDIFGIFLEVMGMGQESSRIEIELEDKPGQLAEITKIIKKHDVNIISVVTAPHDKENKRINVFRLATLTPEPIRKDLEEAGYNIFSVVI